MGTAMSAETTGATDPCRLWPGYTDRFGYGRLNRNGKTLLAHRFVWTQTFGPIPSGMCVCHSCDQPSCVNPNHLFLGTQADNMRDMARKGRSTRLEKNPSAKLTAEQVRAIRSDDRPPPEIAAEYRIAPNTVSGIRARRSWKHLPE